MGRVQLHNPAADSGVIEVEEEQVQTLLDAGWERLSGTGRRRRSENTDTGQNAVQGRSER